MFNDGNMMITLKEKLKKDLKVFRYNFGYFADKVGISQSHLSNILSGLKTPPDDLAKKLAIVATALTEQEYTQEQFQSKD